MRASRVVMTGLAMGAACVVGSVPGHAAELVLGGEASAEYDSNVFSSESDEKQDGSGVFGPILRLQERHRALQYDIAYQPTYHHYLTADGVNGFEQKLRAEGSYSMSPRTEISAQNNFYILQSISRQAFVTDLTLEPVVENTRESILIDEYGASVSHLFTHRLRGSLAFQGYLYDPEDPQDSSSLTNGGSASAVYALTARDLVGGGVGYTHQHFEQSIATDSTTQFFRGFASWEHVFDDTFKFSIQAGPTWIQPEDVKSSDTENVQLLPTNTRGGQTFFIDFLTCPALPDGTRLLLSSCQPLSTPLTPALEDFARTRGDVPVTGKSAKVDGRLTFFGELNISKRWDEVDTWLGYRRSNGSSSGSGTSTVNDTVWGTVNWRPDRLWTFNLTARWDRQKAATDSVVPVQTVLPLPTPVGFAAVVNGVQNIEVKDSIDVKTTSLYLTADRRITKRLFTFARASWLHQKSGSETADTSGYDDFRVGLGLRYEFDPIEIPYL